MDSTNFEEFYRQMSTSSNFDVRSLLPDGINQEVGHFNVFNMEELLERIRQKPVMPYNRRPFGVADYGRLGRNRPFQYPRRHALRFH